MDKNHLHGNKDSYRMRSKYLRVLKVAQKLFA